MRINTNIGSLQAQRQLSLTTKAISRSLARLSSGKRINSAADDASGLGVSVGLRSQTRGIAQIVRNINDSLGYLNTADSALSTQLDLLQRMRELAIQSSNGTLSVGDRGNLQREFQALYDEFNRITETSSFNGTSLLNGEFSDLQVQVGLNKNDSFSIGVDDTLPANTFYEDTLVSTQTFSSTNSASGLTFEGTYAGTRQYVDIDGDGRTDYLYMGSEGVGSSTGVLHFYTSNGDGTFQLASTLYTTNNVSSRFIVEDLDGDDRMDIVSVDGAGSITIYMQDAQGNFSVSDTDAWTSAVTAVDFDGDGDLDLYGHLSGVFYYLENQGSGQFAPLQTTATAASYTFGTPTDVNGDGRLDLHYYSTAAATGVVKLFNADGTFSAAATYSNGSSTSVRGFKDINGDGHLDMLAASSTTNTLVWRLNNGDGTFGAASNTSFGSTVSTFSFEDMNNDGRTDAIINLSSGVVEVLLGQANGTFASAGTQVLLASAVFLPGNDLDGDGDLDFASYRNATGVFAWALNDGTGMFSSIQTAYGGAANTTYSFRDLDGDGLPDLIGTSITRVSARINQGGQFDATGQIISSTWGTAGYGDFNGDGFTDFAVSLASNPAAPTIAVYLQQTEVSRDFVAIDIESQSAAQDALDILDTAILEVTGRRAQIGALQNRLDSALISNLTLNENLSEALSRMEDADIAVETAELLKNQILQQAATSVLAQANLQLQVVLQLLADR